MKRKHLTITILLVCIGLVLGIGAVATQKIADSEKKLSIDLLPAAVKAAILAEANGGTIGEIEKETGDGITFYEAEVTINGQEVDVKVSPDGKLLGKETEADDDDDADDKDEDDDEGEVQVSIDQVPAAVKAVILKEADGLKIEEIVLEDGVYEAEVIVNGQEVDIRVSAEGTLLGKEVENEEEDAE